MTDIDTGFNVYLLGDEATSQRMDLLAEKAAESGAVIAQTFAFPPGDAAHSDDLTQVDAVVQALGLAIATRTPIWIPFWLQDLSREQHLRRLGLTLQRHGVDLLLGPQLAPCPVDGGINEIDAAMRSEVRAVFELDDAAMAAAGMRALGAEIEDALLQSAPFERVAEPPIDEPEPEPAERFFGTAEVAALFGKSPGWVSKGLREGMFVFADGSPVEPVRIGKAARFTVEMIRAVAWSTYRRGTISPRHLQEVLAELARSER
ncbi:MAG: hypothetical protein ACR2JM_13500 [Mycobacterium sp.]